MQRCRDPLLQQKQHHQAHTCSSWAPCACLLPARPRPRGGVNSPKMYPPPRLHTTQGLPPAPAIRIQSTPAPLLWQTQAIILSQMVIGTHVTTVSFSGRTCSSWAPCACLLPAHPMPHGSGSGQTGSGQPHLAAACQQPCRHKHNRHRVSHDHQHSECKMCCRCQP
jgi:hypothetical protein